MHYDDYHNHKWARELGYARQLVNAGKLRAFYEGEDIYDGDIYPGMRIAAAYLVGVEHEMPLRVQKFLAGSGHAEWPSDPEIAAQRVEYFERFLADMRDLVQNEGIAEAGRIDTLAARGFELPPDWKQQMSTMQQASEAALAEDSLPEALIEQWFDFCLRSIANYNRALIEGAVICAALYRREGPEALRAAIDATGEDFMWEASRAFFVEVLPAAGFEDLGDLMDVGLRGMWLDNDLAKEPDQIDEAGVTHATRIIRNCQLAGIFWRVASWNGLDQLALGYGCCRFCELHGQATMEITLPPMVSPHYRLERSLALDGEACRFALDMIPADDMERLQRAHARVFGAMEA